MNLRRLNPPRFSWLLPLVAWAISIGPARATSPVQAFIDQEIVLGSYHETRYDPTARRCMALRAPTLVVDQHPKRGTLSVQRSEEVIADPRCPGLRGPVVTLIYRANGQGPGNDEASWHIIHQAAQLGSQAYRVQIEVQARR